MQTQDSSQALQAELEAVEAEKTSVEAAIARNNGSDRDAAALRALTAQRRELGVRMMALRREVQRLARANG